MSSFESYKDSYTGDKKVQKLWIHHFVILQLFHPLFRFHNGEDAHDAIVFLNKNHNLFVVKMNDDQIKKLYIKTHDDNPNFSWLWLGHGGRM